MRHEPVDFDNIDSRPLGRGQDRIGDVDDGVLEHFLALHAQEASRARRGRPAIDIKQVVQPTIGIKLGVENAAICCASFALACPQYDGASAVAEQDASCPVSPVHQPRHGLGADQQNRLGLPTANEIIGYRQTIDEAGAHGLNVESRTANHAQARLNFRSDGGECFVRCRRRDNDKVEVVYTYLRVGQRGLRRMEGKIGCRLAFGGNVTAFDAGACANPLVACIDLLREFAVAQHAFRQICTATDNLRSYDAHEAPAPDAPAAAATGKTTPARSATILEMTSARTMSIAISSALAKPKASVPPWLFTTIPLRPRKMPPLDARGSSLRRRARSAPVARKPPMRPRNERVSALRRKWMTSLAVPSAVLSATLPVKPSVTTTSTVPSEISSPSTKPQNSMGRVTLRNICAAPRTASLPFTSSAPTLRMPTVGRSRPRTARANASPITAKSTSWSASVPILAPTSSTTLCPRLVGHSAAIAGRSIFSRTRSCTIDIAMSAPVFPAETTTSASFFATDSMACHMLVLRPRRSAWLGFSSIRTRSGEWRISVLAASLGRLAISGFNSASSPFSKKRTVGWRTTARATAATTMPGPASPPIASIETVRVVATFASLPR